MKEITMLSFILLRDGTDVTVIRWDHLNGNKSSRIRAQDPKHTRKLLRRNAKNYLRTEALSAHEERAYESEHA
jgi:hypothetical protein